MDAEPKSKASHTTQGLLLPASLKPPFKDLSISGVVLHDRSYVLHDGDLRVYLQLSSIPPLGWSFLFSNAWAAAQRAGADKPQAGIEGDAIWIECVPDQIRESHLPALEDAVAQTNAAYRDLLRQKAVAQQTQRQLDTCSRLKLHDLQRSLESQGRLVTPQRKDRMGWTSYLLAVASSILKRHKK